MATKSFTDTYVINCEDVGRFHNIMKNERKARITKVIGHKDVKSKKAIMEMLDIKKRCFIELYLYTIYKDMKKKSERIISRGFFPIFLVH